MQRKLFGSTRETTLRETESVQHGKGGGGPHNKGDYGGYGPAGVVMGTRKPRRVAFNSKQGFSTLAPLAF